MPCGWEGNRRSGVTDNSGITTYGLMALGREMSIPPQLHACDTFLAAADAELLQACHDGVACAQYIQ